jgi:hypothetical protein
MEEMPTFGQLGATLVNTTAHHARSGVSRSSGQFRGTPEIARCTAAGQTGH